MLDNYNIILASNSPRRKELLKGLDLDFRVETIKDIDESYPENLVGDDIVKFISNKKSNAYECWIDEHTMIITADTIVWHNGKALGKPKDHQDAIEMLKKLSGKTHTVYTGVSIKTKERTVLFADSTDVTFSALSDSEINYYVDKYKPMDKAGAYGVQEWIGYIGVDRINGSYFNIMGLPVQKLYAELKKFDEACL